MNTTKALGVLNLKPKDIYSLIEAEKFDDVSNKYWYTYVLLPRFLNLSVDLFLNYCLYQDLNCILFITALCIYDPF